MNPRVALTMLLALVIGCGGGGESGAPVTTVTAATPAAPPGGDVAMDWTTRPAVDAGGWLLAGCEGAAPLYCVSERGTPVGLVELASFPLDSFESLRGLDRFGALARLAADADRSTREDRENGCAPGSTYQSIPVRTLTVAGQPGVRFGFTVTSPQGASAERSVTYATIVGEDVVLTVAAAFGEGSCVSAEGTQFDPDTLERFEPVLDRLVSEMVLP